MAARPETRPVTTPPAPVEVVIGPLRRRDLRSVVRIENEVYPRPWSLGLFVTEVAKRADRLYLSARVGSEVVGYAGLMLTGSDAHVTTVAVDPAWQRHKIATRLMLVLCRAAADHGCTALTLEVRMGNRGAQELYRRFGFAPAGVRKGYYVETNEDALIMWAHDIDLSPYAERLLEIEATVPGATRVERT